MTNKKVKKTVKTTQIKKNEQKKPAVSKKSTSVKKKASKSKTTAKKSQDKDAKVAEVIVKSLVNKPKLSNPNPNIAASLAAQINVPFNQPRPCGDKIDASNYRSLSTVVRPSFGSNRVVFKATGL